MADNLHHGHPRVRRPAVYQEARPAPVHDAVAALEGAVREVYEQNG